MTYLGRNTKVHMVVANDRLRCFSLSSGEKHDAPEKHKLISQLKVNEPCSLLMDRAYEDEQIRLLAIKHGFIPVVPPKKKRLQHWEYDKELYINRSFLVGLGYTKTSFSNELFIETLFKRAVLTFVISIVFVFYLNDNN